jgi:thymidylate synthase
MNKLDKTYTDLLQDILDNGVKKQDRTGTGTISVFGRQIRHDMKDGFPLLTTKKMPFKTIVTELLWFLRGDTNIKYLVDNGCNIWNGDAYKNYIFNSEWFPISSVNGGFIGTKTDSDEIMTQERFIEKIKTDDEFAKTWGELGPIYGKQWRQWNTLETEFEGFSGIDQIATLINDLKTNPDSRRLMVNAWNVGELDQMVLPPCHYGFQVYTRELSFDERFLILSDRNLIDSFHNLSDKKYNSRLNELNIPTRTISLMWNQRSCDFPLGIPFNIASYGLLLEIIAKEVNMVPDELIGNLGDCHIYLNQIEGCKEQIGRDLTIEERFELWNNKENRYAMETYNNYTTDTQRHIFLSDRHQGSVPKKTREPYGLPTLKIVGYPEEYNYPNDERLFEEFDISDFVIEDYQSHPTIKYPLSN